MAIPAGYENTPGKCRICGATVNDGTESVLEVEIRRPRPVMPPKKSNPVKTVVHALSWGLLWGLIGAVVAGILMAVVLTLRGKVGDILTVKAVVALLGGAVVGFIIGATVGRPDDD
jgi:hypothetical protein